MKTKNGFTLVELIVVIVIIGILALISVIGYSNQAERARNNSVFSSLSEAVKAVNVCLANGDTVNTLTPGTAICAPATAGEQTAVAGNWPDLAAIGGSWVYASGGAVPPNGYDATAGTLNILAWVGSAATDANVSCTLTGCTRANF